MFWFVGKNPDALPPTTAFGRMFLKLGTFFRFFKSPEGIFGLRHAVVSVALWVPSVCASSAWFYYGNRGLWALIMAQVSRVALTRVFKKLIRYDRPPLLSMQAIR